MTTSTLGQAPTSDVDPFGRDELADPLPFQEQLREAGPVVLLTRYGVFGLARYEQVHAALVDWETFQSSAGVGLSDFRREKPWRPPSLLLEADPPAHDAPRAVLAKVLSARALKSLREQWLADADQLVGELVGRGSFDGVADLAEAFPLRVFPSAVGLPEEGRENLLPYGTFLFNSFGPRNELMTAGLPDAGRLAEWVNAHCQRDRLAPGGFGAAIWAAADDGQLTAEQAPLVVRSLLSAGVDTTVNGLAALLYCLAANPEQWQALRADPGLARFAFEEAVRFESPVQTFFRTTTRDVDVDGVTIPEGRKILMFLGAANRDPRHWDEPDRFDVRRNASGHVGFGMGIHQCVGQHVARLEAEAVVTALVRRVDRLELSGEPVRKLNNTLRAWQSLPLTVTAA